MKYLPENDIAETQISLAQTLGYFEEAFETTSVNLQNRLVGSMLIEQEETEFKPFIKNSLELDDIDVTSPITTRLQKPSSINDYGALNDDHIVDVRRLFVDFSFASPELQTAFRLLDECEELINDAIESLRHEDIISSDSSVMQIKLLLPELFCCRKIGESFGAIISSIANAFDNRRGEPFEEHQLMAFRKLIIQLKARPEMNFNSAMDLIEEFEDTGFDISLPGMEFLLELAQLANE